jgi:hypothetical protein
VQEGIDVLTKHMKEEIWSRCTGMEVVSKGTSMEIGLKSASKKRYMGIGQVLLEKWRSLKSIQKARWRLTKHKAKKMNMQRVPKVRREKDGK